MKKTATFIVFLTIYNICFAQKDEILQENYPLTIKQYNLELSFDFKKGYLYGICNITIENKSHRSLNEIPFLLYRLVKITSIKNQQEETLSFDQYIVSYTDFEKNTGKLHYQ